MSLRPVAGPLTGVVGLTSTLLGLGLLSALGLVLFSAATKTSLDWSLSDGVLLQDTGALSRRPWSGQIRSGADAPIGCAA